jgi:hypothetical protein
MGIVFGQRMFHTALWLNIYLPVLSDDITLIYSASKTIVNDLHAEGTLGDLWVKSTGPTLSDKSRKNFILDLYAIVDYPPLDAAQV